MYCTSRYCQCLEHRIPKIPAREWRQRHRWQRPSRDMSISALDSRALTAENRYDMRREREYRAQGEGEPSDYARGRSERRYHMLMVWFEPRGSRPREEGQQSKQPSGNGEPRHSMPDAETPASCAPCLLRPLLCAMGMQNRENACSPWMSGSGCAQGRLTWLHVLTGRGRYPMRPCAGELHSTPAVCRKSISYGV